MIISLGVTYSGAGGSLTFMVPSYHVDTSVNTGVRYYIPMTTPTHGWTRRGLPVHAHTFDHLPGRFNRWLAVKITGIVGSMWCAYAFTLIALVSLPAVLTQAFGLHIFPHWLVSVGLIALVAWIAQTFLQLVLLSVIMVGQNVQQAASDARSSKTFEDTERILDALNLETQGGLADVLKAIEALHGQ